MREFDPIDKEIIRALYVEGIPLTISEVSRKTGISWITVKKHAKHLEKKGVIDMIATETRKTPKLALDFNILQRLKCFYFWVILVYSYQFFLFLVP